MTDPNNELYKPRGKGKKALHRVIALNEKLAIIEKHLDTVRRKLKELLENAEKTVEYTKAKPKCLVKLIGLKEPGRQRSMLDFVLKRIEFYFSRLRFYIDFTAVGSEGDDLVNVKGSIVYGTSRTLCFSECIFPKNSKCIRCERISRCDGLEDKPLIHFTINQHGMIQSSGELDGEWWIEDKSDLLELHYRALDLIWKQALDWSNEKILP